MDTRLTQKQKMDPRVREDDRGEEQDHAAIVGHSIFKNLHFLKNVLYLSMRKRSYFRSRISWLLLRTTRLFCCHFRRLLHAIIRQFQVFFVKSAPSKSFLLPTSALFQTPELLPTFSPPPNRTKCIFRP